MRRQRRTTIIVVGGALAIASVGYGLGTQAGDGTAIADNASTEQDGSAPDRHGGAPPGFERGAPPGIDTLATKLGVKQSDLMKALRDFHDQNDANRRDDLSAALADALGVSSDRVKSAFDTLRRRGEDRFAARLADALGVDTAKVRAALEKLQGDRPRSPGDFAQSLAGELGLDASDVQSALMKIRPFPGPGRGAPGPGGPLPDRGAPGPGPGGPGFHRDQAAPLKPLAKALGVSRADLRRAFRELRAGAEDHFKQERQALAKFLADRFDLDVTEVQDALAAVAPPLRSPHSPGPRDHPTPL
jgi:Clp amino terminal domain, pathogenicity island component